MSIYSPLRSPSIVKNIFILYLKSVYRLRSFNLTANGSGIAEGGDYLHNSPSEAQKFNVVQLLISGTSAPTFGNTLLAAGVFKLT